MVITHGKRGPEVRGQGDGGVAARLEHTLPLPLEGLHVPLVDGPIHTAADQPSVVRVPHDATNLR